MCKKRDSLSQDDKDVKGLTKQFFFYFLQIMNRNLKEMQLLNIKLKIQQINKTFNLNFNFVFILFF